MSEAEYLAEYLALPPCVCGFVRICVTDGTASALADTANESMATPQARLEKLQISGPDTQTFQVRHVPDMG